MPAKAPRTPEQADRLAEIVAMRRQRVSMTEIGRRLGISHQRVSQLYSQALAMFPAQQVEEHRAEELMLIDDAIAGLLSLANDHTHPRIAVEAWTAIRGWAERKAKLLGLDAPAKFEVLTLDAIDAEIKRLQAELGARENVDAP